MSMISRKVKVNTESPCLVPQVKRILVPCCVMMPHASRISTQFCLATAAAAVSAAAAAASPQWACTCFAFEMAPALKLGTRLSLQKHPGCKDHEVVVFHASYSLRYEARGDGCDVCIRMHYP